MLYSILETFREFRLVLVGLFGLAGYFAIVAAVPVVILWVVSMLVIIFKS